MKDFIGGPVIFNLNVSTNVITSIRVDVTFVFMTWRVLAAIDRFFDIFYYTSFFFLSRYCVRLQIYSWKNFVVLSFDIFLFI